MMLACAVLLLTAGCDRNPDMPDIGASGPTFDPLVFFAGHVRSWGVLESRSGAPTGWVVTDCEGHAESPDRLTVVQHLTFAHDKPQDRRWTLWRTGPNTFKATANDMVGSATGETSGRVFHWQWVLARSAGERPFGVTMTQWMYAMDDGSALIRTTVSKFGFILAEVSEHFAHVDAPASVGVAGSAGKQPG
jgi:hypothetical protein